MAEGQTPDEVYIGIGKPEKESSKTSVYEPVSVSDALQIPQNDIDMLNLQLEATRLIELYLEKKDFDSKITDSLSPLYTQLTNLKSIEQMSRYSSKSLSHPDTGQVFQLVFQNAEETWDITQDHGTVAVNQYDLDHNQLETFSLQQIYERGKQKVQHDIEHISQTLKAPKVTNKPRHIDKISQWVLAKNKINVVLHGFSAIVNDIKSTGIKGQHQKDLHYYQELWTNNDGLSVSQLKDWVDERTSFTEFGRDGKDTKIRIHEVTVQADIPEGELTLPETFLSPLWKDISTNARKAFKTTESDKPFEQQIHVLVDHDPKTQQPFLCLYFDDNGPGFAQAIIERGKFVHGDKTGYADKRINSNGEGMASQTDLFQEYGAEIIPANIVDDQGKILGGRVIVKIPYKN